MSKSILITLMAGVLIVIMINSAWAQQTDRCEAILQYAGTETESVASIDEEVALNYRQYCENNAYTRSENKAREAAARIKLFGGSASRSRQSVEQKVKQWCDENKQTAISFGTQNIERKTVFAKSVDAWRACIELASEGIFIDPRVNPDQSRQITLTISKQGAGSILFNNVTGINYTCTGRVAAQPTITNLEEPEQEIEITASEPFTITCNRNLTRETLRNTDGQEYEEIPAASITISTATRSPFLLAVPAIEYAPPLSQAQIIRKEISDLRESLRDSVPIGTIYAYYGDNPPDTFLICNGDPVNQAKYRELYEHLKRTNPNLVAQEPGIGEVVYLPDLRGQFLRGLNTEGNIDPDKEREIGSAQEHAIENIRGDIKGISEAFEGGGRASGAFKKGGAYNLYPTNAQYADNGNAGIVSFDASRVVNTSTETRPKNIAVNFIIKASE